MFGDLLVPILAARRAVAQSRRVTLEFVLASSEAYYTGKIHHGRLYPNLGTLV